jgi:Sec-independent protein secretion pathway component TatC
MNLQKQILIMETKAKLSTLWMFYLFNTIFRDIHEFIEPGFIEQVMTGTFNGIQITEELLLFGGFVAEVPIAMVLLSRILPYGANRWANIIAAVITLAFEINNGTTDLDDTFHMIIEIAALCFIIWSAWRWRNPAPKSYSAVQKA